MVKLSVEMITKLGPGFNKRRPDETVDHYLSRLTHIYLQEKHIDGIDLIPICKNLTVIYLYDNKIGKLENFEFAPNLTHLYLQNNRIKRIENLGHLTKLTKLHLGGNCLKMVEGLENMNELVELSIENQDLPPGERLIFDPRCLMTLKNSLRILNISGNKMDSLGEIGSLVNLELLDASRNCLNDMKEMSVMLKCWPHLVDLNLSGNPLCAKNKYRERIIVLAPNVKMLDGKEIQDLSRQFLQNWKLSKEMMNANQIQQQQQQQQQPKQSLIERNFESNEYNAAAASLNSTRVEMNKLNAMPTYIMPEQRKQLTSSHSSKLRTGHIGNPTLGYLTHQSPERKQTNGMGSGRIGLPSASAKSSLKGDFASGSFNGINSLSTTGLALNSNKVKHKTASSKKLADMF